MGFVGAGEADIDWDVAGAIGHRFNDRVSSVIGYRALGVDYSNDDGFLDVVQEGRFWDSLSGLLWAQRVRWILTAPLACSHSARRRSMQPEQCP